MSDIVTETQDTRHKIVLYPWLLYQNRMAGWERHTAVPDTSAPTQSQWYGDMPHWTYVQDGRIVLPPTQGYGSSKKVLLIWHS